MFALLLAAVLSVVALPAQAYAVPDTSKIYTSGDVSFRACAPNSDINHWHALITGCKDKASVTVPKTVTADNTEMRVEDINFNSFNGKKSLGTLIIEPEVKKLPTSMCAGCTNLETVEVPNTVIEVGAYAFDGCTKLRWVDDLTAVKGIRTSAFRGCSSLRWLHTERLRFIEEGAFKGCTELRTIVASDDDGTANGDLTRIDPSAFSGCSSLENVGNVGSVKSVGGFAFYECTSLKKIEFSALTVLGEYAFWGCTRLKSVELGNVKTIGAHAFEFCRELMYSQVNPTTQTVGAYAFRGCAAISYVTFFDALTKVGDGAFENCTQLNSITFANNLTSLPAKAFKGCTKLQYVRIPVSVSGSIGSEAFGNCTNLKDAYVLNQGVTFESLGSADPFNGCSGLKLYGYAPCTAKTYADATKGVTFVNLESDKVTVAFDSGGGTGSMPSIEVARNGDFVLPENTAFAKAGFSFNGWSVQKSFGPAEDRWPGDLVEGVTENTVCTAQWKAGSRVTLKRPDVSIEETYGLGSEYVVPDCPFDPPTGKVFGCWFVDADGDGMRDDGEMVYLPGAVVDHLPASLALTADWVTQVKVILNANGGAFEDGVTSREAATGKYGTLEEFPEVTRDGFELKGWQVYDSNAHSTSLVSAETVLASSQYLTQVSSSEWVVKLTAIWTPNAPRAIALDPNGGAINGSEDSVLLMTESDGKIADSKILAFSPERASYRFERWSDGSERMFITGGQSTFNADTTLVALWDPILVSSVSLSDSALTLVAGESRQLSANVTPADALDTSVVWSTSNGAVATVGPDGAVVAVAQGTATVTCASTDGGAEATCEVKVTAAPGAGDAGSGDTAPGADDAALGADGTALGAGAAAEAADTFLTSYVKEKDPAGSTFELLRLKAAKVTKASIKLTWTKQAKAASYVVYGAKCGAKKLAKVATIGKAKAKGTGAAKGTVIFTWKKLAGKKLAKNTYYKAVVVAVDAKGKVVATSKMVHAATAGGSKGNPVKVTSAAKGGAVTLAKGRAFKLGAKVVKPAGKKVARHRAADVMYVTSNKKIATVSAAGKVKAKKVGTCYVYAYAQNGVAAKVKVTVKAQAAASAVKPAATYLTAATALTAAR